MVQRNRVIISGAMGTGGEVWSVGINYMPDPVTPASYVTTQEDLNEWASLISDVLEGSSYDILRNPLSDQVTSTNVQTQKFANDNTLERQSIVTSSGFAGLGNAYKPYQTSIVFSLSTGIPGASFRGRIYWPGVGAGIASTGRLTTPTAPANMVAPMANLIAEIGTVAPAGFAMIPCVFSPTRNLVTAVTQVRVGNVPDTQRRRRDALIETYVDADVPTP